MASFTKKAIVASFLKMCTRKPPDKITVRDIVDDCEINRNTFYYYFQDIYALAAEVFALWTADFVSACEDDRDIAEGLCSITQWAMENKKAATNIYLAFAGSLLEEYYLNATLRAWINWTRNQSKTLPVSEEAVRYVGETCAEGFFTILRRWMKGGMREDAELIVQHYVKTWLDYVETALLNYERCFGKIGQNEKNV